MKITVVFKSDEDETVHLSIGKYKTLEEVSAWVHENFSGVAYIAFN